MSVSYSTHFVMIRKIDGDLEKNTPLFNSYREYFGTFLLIFLPMRNFVYFFTFYRYIISSVVSQASADFNNFLLFLVSSIILSLFSGILKIY